MMKLFALALSLLMCITPLANAQKPEPQKIDEREWLILYQIKDTVYGFDPNSYAMVTENDLFTFDVVLIFAEDSFKFDNKSVAGAVLEVLGSCNTNEVKILRDTIFDKHARALDSGQLSKTDEFEVPHNQSVYGIVMNAVCRQKNSLSSNSEILL